MSKQFPQLSKVLSLPSSNAFVFMHGILCALRIRLSEIREGDASMHCLSEVLALVERIYRNIYIYIHGYIRIYIYIL